MARHPSVKTVTLRYNQIGWNTKKIISRLIKEVFWHAKPSAIYLKRGKIQRKLLSVGAKMYDRE